MKKILAVSGGVDSVVMLEIFRDDAEVVVAHFHHGTRPSADFDQEFVRKLARNYNKPFFTARAQLGENASEAAARVARYQFLRTLAREHGAEIYTAHHGDDLIETMAINYLRGTGWRGMAPLGAPGVVRPLLQPEKLPEDAREFFMKTHAEKNFANEIFMNEKAQEKSIDADEKNLHLPLFKSDLLRYAAAKNLTFRADPTNQEENYLRNRLRRKLIDLSVEEKKQLCQVYLAQKNLKFMIEKIVTELLPEDRVYWRKWFDAERMPEVVAIEFLRTALLNAGATATRPQIVNFLHAIQEYSPGKTFNLPGGKLVKIWRDYFIL